jgi:hypothetical protein
MTVPITHRVPQTHLVFHPVTHLVTQPVTLIVASLVP